jgi:hypothetical protein
MPDEKEKDAASELTELEPLPELPADDDPPAELAELPDMPADAPPASGAAPNVPPIDSSGPPPLRELDKAPLHLRTAALVAACGCLLPWMGHPSVVSGLLAKAVVLLGVYFWYSQVAHNWGPKLTGFLGNMAELQLGGKKEEPEKPRRRSIQGEGPTTLKHPFPTGLHALSLLMILAGVIALPLFDGKLKAAEDDIAPFKVMAELGMLAWAAYTWVHIFAYERWGNFNPLFPLMFLGMLFGGLASAIGALAIDDTAVKLAGLLGGALVGLGGGMAAFTIVEAMMAAKKEGDAKREAAIEARKAARNSRRR